MTLGFEGVLVCGVADEDLGEQVVTLAGGIEEMDERSAYCHVCISSPLNSNSQRQNLGAGTATTTSSCGNVHSTAAAAAAADNPLLENDKYGSSSSSSGSNSSSSSSSTVLEELGASPSPPPPPPLPVDPQNDARIINTWRTMRPNGKNGIEAGNKFVLSASDNGGRAHDGGAGLFTRPTRINSRCSGGRGGRGSGIHAAAAAAIIGLVLVLDAVDVTATKNVLWDEEMNLATLALEKLGDSGGGGGGGGGDHNYHRAAPSYGSDGYRRWLDHDEEKEALEDSVHHGSLRRAGAGGAQLSPPQTGEEIGYISRVDPRRLSGRTLGMVTVQQSVGTLTTTTDVATLETDGRVEDTAEFEILGKPAIEETRSPTIPTPASATAAATNVMEVVNSPAPANSESPAASNDEVKTKKATPMDVRRPEVDMEEEEISCGSPWRIPCFDRSRCVDPDGKQTLTVYVHDAVCSDTPSKALLANSSFAGTNSQCDWLCHDGTEAARRVADRRGILVETPPAACVVVDVLPIRSWCVHHSSTWREGLNNLLVDFADQSRASRTTMEGVAMFAKSNMKHGDYRHGHDIAIPLPPKLELEDLQGLAPLGRKYFATFKGQLYLSSDGELERSVVRQLGPPYPNPTGVVISEVCQKIHPELLDLPGNQEMCDQLDVEFKATDYVDLMNTTFAIIPAGRSPATYRLGEALSAGAIPVFVNNDFVKPYPDRIPWRLFSYSFPTEEIPRLVDTLRSVSEKDLVKMQATAVQVYHEYFEGKLDGIMETTFDILEQRLAFQSERRRLPSGTN